MSLVTSGLHKMYVMTIFCKKKKKILVMLLLLAKRLAMVKIPQSL